MNKILLLLCAVFLGFSSQALALPKPARVLSVTVAGNTYNAYSEIVTLAGNERYATVKLRKGTLDGMLAWTASPNTYTSNAVAHEIVQGELKELWNFNLFGGSKTWYGSPTCTAGSVTFDISTYYNTIP